MTAPKPTVDPFKAAPEDAEAETAARLAEALMLDMSEEDDDTLEATSEVELGATEMVDTLAATAADEAEVASVEFEEEVELAAPVMTLGA